MKINIPVDKNWIIKMQLETTLSSVRGVYGPDYS